MDSILDKADEECVVSVVPLYVGQQGVVLQHSGVGEVIHGPQHHEVCLGHMSTLSLHNWLDLGEEFVLELFKHVPLLDLVEASERALVLSQFPSIEFGIV